MMIIPIILSTYVYALIEFQRFSYFRKMTLIFENIFKKNLTFDYDGDIILQFTGQTLNRESQQDTSSGTKS